MLPDWGEDKSSLKSAAPLALGTSVWVRATANNGVSAQSLLLQVGADCSPGVKKKTNQKKLFYPQYISLEGSKAYCSGSQTPGLGPGPSWSEEQGCITAILIILPSS